jgi:hypothetical protein
MPDFMPNYLELPIGPKCPEVVNAVIEIPLEGINKYEYDKELHVFRLASSPPRSETTAIRSTAWCWSTRPAFPAASWRSGPSAFSR